MRIQGELDVNAANVELKNRKGEPIPERPINAEDIEAILEDKHRSLVAEHGPGQFTHSLDASHSQITWQFDYAEKVKVGIGDNEAAAMRRVLEDDASDEDREVVRNFLDKADRETGKAKSQENLVPGETGDGTKADIDPGHVVPGTEDS